MKKKAVIFDLDGTLLDTLTDLAASVNYALSAMGYPERTTDEIRTFVGNGVGSLIRKAVPENTDAARINETLELFSEYYGRHLNDNTKPYVGIEELLRNLKTNGIKTGVVSNKFDAAVKNLCRDIFGGKLDVCVGERSGVRRKPAPDGVLTALGTLKVSAADAVYVGDSDTDALTARNAGMDFVGVDWGFRTREVLESGGAEKIASSADELMRILETM